MPSMYTRFGFRMLTLGWSDGSTFLPINSILLTSGKQKNRVNEAETLDKRTAEYRRRKLSMTKGTEAMLELLQAAKAAAFRQNTFFLIAGLRLKVPFTP